MPNKTDKTDKAGAKTPKKKHFLFFRNMIVPSHLRFCNG